MQFVADMRAAFRSKGTINACAWSADGAKIVTASADKTIMVIPGFPVASREGTMMRVENRHNGIVWLGSSSVQGLLVEHHRRWNDLRVGTLVRLKSGGGCM